MESDHLSEYRGLIGRSPVAASVLALFMLSLTGIPPLAGFIGKVYLFMAAIDARYYWLVVVAVVNSVVSFVYYGGVIKRMFLEEGVNQQPIVLPRLSNALLALLGIAVLAMGLYWGPLAEYSQESAGMLFQSAPIAKK
jgi:NADH-quinone oxidoreductase subunit N